MRLGSSNWDFASALLGAAAVLLPIAWVYRWDQPVRIRMLHYMGRTGGCSLSELTRGHVQTNTILAVLQGVRENTALVRRAPDGFQLWNTPYGQFWTPAGENPAFVVGEQAGNTYGSGEAFVHPGDIVLDCGANIGAFTRKALLAGAKTVVAVEPVPVIVEALRRTFEEEVRSGRVIVYPKGVWDKDDVLEMEVGASSPQSSFVIKQSAPKSRLTLQLTTIDKLAAELNLPKVDFIKMDIEGAESKALRGAAKTIQTHHPRMAIATEHSPGDDVALPDLIRQIDPNYRQACGPCFFKNRFYFGPEVINFY